LSDCVHDIQPIKCIHSMSGLSWNARDQNLVRSTSVDTYPETRQWWVVLLADKHNA
jgi:hypothetical protein